MADESQVGHEVVGYITLPLYKMRPRHFPMLHQTMLDCGPHSASTAAGLGGDQVYAEVSVGTEKKPAHDFYWVHGRDLLAATLAKIGHADAGEIPTTEAFKVAVVPVQDNVTPEGGRAA